MAYGQQHKKLQIFYFCEGNTSKLVIFTGTGKMAVDFFGGLLAQFPIHEPYLQVCKGLNHIPKKSTYLAHNPTNQANTLELATKAKKEVFHFADILSSFSSLNMPIPFPSNTSCQSICRRVDRCMLFLQFVVSFSA